MKSDTGPGNKNLLSVMRQNVPLMLVGALLIASAIIVALSVMGSRQQREVTAEWERHSYNVLIQTQTVSAAIDNTEIGSRGYLLTGDPQFLKTFNDGMNAAPRELARLEGLIRDNDGQQGNVEELALIVKQRIARLRQGIEQAVAGNQVGAVELVKPGQGFASMANVQAALADIDRIERELLQQRHDSNDAAMQRSDLLIGALVLLMIAMAAYGTYTLVTATRSQARSASLEAEQALTQQLRDTDAAAVRAAAIVTAVGAATPDLIYAKDREGRITYANPSTLSVIGISLDDLLGKLTVDYNNVREQAEQIDANDARIMNAGVTEIIDEEFTGADGEARLFRSTKTPLHDAAGQVIGLSGVSIDVTAERAAMAALKVSEERFRTLSETAPAFIFITDDKGEVTYTNTAFQTYTGKSNNELTGMGWVRAVHRDDRKIPEKAWAQAVSNKKPYAAEYRFRNCDGVFRWFMCRATPLLDSGGTIRQWIGTCSDIQDAIDAREGLEAKVTERTAELQAALETLRREVTERERAEAQVRQMQKIESIGQLTGGIAHDFNNMLAVVLGSLEIVKRRMKTDPEKAMLGIDNAEAGAKRAAQLTARLLAFSRQQPLAPEPVNVNRLVSGMSELLRQTIGAQIEIETVLAGGLWRTHIDAPQLENAILNLCVNARDAMNDNDAGGGKLTIETHNCHLDDRYAASNADVSEGQYVLVTVTDTGEGMAPEVIERAFDPFYTTKEVGKGTGLGLSQVFGFVKQSGGHIKIYSEPGDGTTVKLYLPRYFGTEDVAETSTANPAEWPTAKAGETILVVEDDASVRQVSVQLVRDLGYEVIEAASGAQALGTLGGNGRVDLVFTDIVMPGMTGRAMADEAVKLRTGIKILYTTGYTRNAVVHNGVLDPGTEFLAKPYTATALAVKLRAVLDKAIIP